MECKELMIGDWIIFHNSGYASDNTIWREDRICQIDGIGGDVRVKWIEEDGTKEDWPHVSTTDLSPIPLTPEILEKNGFVKILKKVYEFCTDDYRILWPTDNNNTLAVNSYFAKYGILSKQNIDYVHQLQQALRVCEIDKEIEL